METGDWRGGRVHDDRQNLRAKYLSGVWYRAWEV